MRNVATAERSAAMNHFRFWILDFGLRTFMNPKSKIQNPKSIDSRIETSTTPARHQYTTSQLGASRPRNDSSSTPIAALQHNRLIDTTGVGHTTDSASNATNAADASR